MLPLTGRAHRLDQLTGLIPANRLIRDHLRDLSLRSRIGRYKVVFRPLLRFPSPGVSWGRPAGELYHRESNLSSCPSFWNELIYCLTRSTRRLSARPSSESFDATGA